MLFRSDVWRKSLLVQPRPREERLRPLADDGELPQLRASLAGYASNAEPAGPEVERALKKKGTDTRFRHGTEG